MKAPVNVADRFWRFVTPSASDVCWPWQGARHWNGYGQIMVTNPNRKLRAHRVSWELHRGPIPARVYVLHRCDNRPCVNPAHLFLGTQRDNIYDAMAKGRLHIPASRLPGIVVAGIEATLRSGATKAETAKTYGVSESTVWRCARRAAAR